MSQVNLDTKQSTSRNPFNRAWGWYSSLSKSLRVSIIVLALIAVGTPFILGNTEILSQNASSATVTVSNTTTGTIQAQVSTNIPSFAGDITSFPNGQADLTSLALPLVRLHMGDDGGDNMPELKPGSWDMTGINQMVSEVFASGQQPLMNIKFAPDWMWTCYPSSQAFVNNPGQGFVSDTTFGQFAQYMARLVSYYNKGSLTAENGTVLTNPSGTSHRITYWELWNEPEGDWETPCKTPQQNDVALTETQYLTMWNAVTAAMLAVDPTIKFVGPAAANAYTNDGYPTTSGNAYIDIIMNKGTVKPDVLSFHNYGWWESGRPDKTYFDGDGSGNGGQGITDMVTMSQKLRQTYPTMPIWLTEVNVNSDWGGSAINDIELSAAWWGASFAQLVPLGVNTIYQYDLTGANLFGLVDGEGVVTNFSTGATNDATGNKMLPYYVVQALNQAFPPGSTILQSSSAQSGILSLAAKKPDGTVSVLVVNRTIPSSTAMANCGTGGSPETVTVDLSALSPSSITLTQLDKRNINCTSWFGVAPSTQTIPVSNPVTISFPGYGIAILNITSNGQIQPTLLPPTPSPTFYPTPTIPPGATITPIPTTVPTTYSLSGVVYIDANQNGVKDTGEVNYTLGTPVTLTGVTSATQVTNSTGKYTFSSLINGSYTATLTVPAGYKATTVLSKTKIINGANATGVNFGIAPVSGPTPTAIPTTTLPLPTPTPITLSGTNLVIYDNAVSSLFTDNTFSYSSKNVCDTSTYISASCSYAATFQSYGAYEFIYKSGSITPTSYKSLDMDINTNGQAITNFVAFLTTGSGSELSEVVLTSSNVTKNYGNGWVHVSISMSKLDPKNNTFHYVDFGNALNKVIPQIHVDNVELVGY